MMGWYEQSIEEVCRELEADGSSGLSARDAAERLSKNGHNELTQTSTKSVWSIVFEQFANLLVVILLAAALISLALGDTKDAVAIILIVILNAALGFKQEYNAEKAMAALKKLSAPMVRVKRDEELLDIDARDLVIGDLVLIEAGNLVPADARLIETASLKVQESALTGESETVEKTTDALPGSDLPLGDRRNMLYMGTVVSYGRGQAIVTETGMQTELGHIATLLQTTEDEETPLTSKIEHLGKVLVGVALALICVVAAMGFLRGEDWKTVFLTAVSMAVAAVPEGLPAVVTIALALGAKRMLARHALIRKLPAVETLGSVTAICTDKTGTLTQNVMTVTVLELPELRVEFEPSVEKDISLPEQGADDLLFCFGAAALANDATLRKEDESDARFHALGDPTEGALVVAAARAGLFKTALESELPRINEAPFDSDRKRMSTVHKLVPEETGVVLPPSLFVTDAHVEKNTEGIVFSKGATASILDVATSVRVNGQTEELTDERRRKLKLRAEELAAGGVRVLAVAYKPVPVLKRVTSAQQIECDLVFLGLAGMADPLREDVKESVNTCLEAGIRPVMITGDHPLMARHIAADLGMLSTDRVVTGAEISGMSNEELERTVADVSVFARVSPEHKLRIVDALQARGEIASMTGDGVNDAPALKSADIGVAMGITGADVAKEASDMVLLNDNYSTIVSAVREGRVIFDNILRFIRFILASNAGELFVMLAAPLVGMPLPLLPVQILWMNLVTDGLPALALGVERPERDVMTRRPRHPDAPIIDRRMIVGVLWVGALIAALSLFVGFSSWRESTMTPGATAVSAVEAGSHAHVGATSWQTMLFCAMVFAQLFLALGVRSNRDSLFSIGVFTNPALIGAIGLTILLQLAVVYMPLLQGFFKTTSLSPRELGLCFFAATAVFVAVEIQKLVARILSRKTRQR